MIKEDFVKAIDGDKSLNKELVDYLSERIDCFFEKYKDRFPYLETAREFALGDVGSYIIETLDKHRRFIEMKGSLDNTIDYLIKRHYFWR